MDLRVGLYTYTAQWNSANTNTLGPKQCILIREVSVVKLGLDQMS